MAHWSFCNTGKRNPSRASPGKRSPGKGSPGKGNPGKVAQVKVAQVKVAKVKVAQIKVVQIKATGLFKYYNILETILETALKDDCIQSFLELTDFFTCHNIRNWSKV